MNIKRSKLALSITTLLLCLEVMCFGVYSATRVEYSIGGNITYEINAPLVSLSTKLYASKENAFDAKGNVAEVMYNMDLFLNYGEGTMPSSIEEFTTYHSPIQGTYVNGQLTNENTFETTSLPLNFGEFEQNAKAYVYYAVTEISNYAQEPVSMQLDLGDLAFTVDWNSGDDVVPYNTLAIPLKTLDNISAGSADAPTKSYVIVAFTINDLTTNVDTVDFGMSITIDQGELTSTDLSMEGIQTEYNSELGGYVVQNIDYDLGLEKLIYQPNTMME